MPARRKYVYDPVHGSVSLVGPSLDLLGHPLVQRLWGIRQTGMAHLIFPGASHSRLEHSLGVLWVSRAMAQMMGLDKDEALAVEIAGFLHDLGHTPFSHTLEAPLKECTGKGHEDLTQAIILGEAPEAYTRFGAGIPGIRVPSLADLLDRHGISVTEIALLLRSRRPHNRPYLAEMLHGSIDADRIDYLQRDAHYTGVAHGAIDANRLLETLRRVDGHLVFAEKGRPAVEGFLVARSLMYSSVYYNKTVRIAEVMLQSAFERLPGYPGVGPDLLALTDGEFMAALDAAGGRAAEMSERLRVRQLYKRATVLRETDDKGLLRSVSRLSQNPAARRRTEDLLAEGFGGRAGEVLLDLAGSHHGLGPDGQPLPPEEVRVLEGGAVVDLLKVSPVWAPLVARAPTPWAVALYVPPKLREAAERRGPRLLERYL